MDATTSERRNVHVMVPHARYRRGGKGSPGVSMFEPFDEEVNLVGESPNFAGEIALGVFGSNNAVENVVEERRSFDLGIKSLVSVKTTDKSRGSGGSRGRRDGRRSEYMVVDYRGLLRGGRIDSYRRTR